MTGFAERLVMWRLIYLVLVIGLPLWRLFEAETKSLHDSFSSEPRKPIPDLRLDEDEYVFEAPVLAILAL